MTTKALPTQKAVANPPHNPGASRMRITAPNYQYVRFTISNEGCESLIVNRFSEKSKQELIDRDQNKKGGRNKERPPRDPQAEYKASAYCLPGPRTGEKGVRYGLKAIGFKKALVRAGKPIDGITMVDLTQNVFVAADEAGLIEIKGKPQMREDMVRIGKAPNKSPQVRYRAEFLKWSAKIAIRFNADMFDAEEIINLFARAGMGVGWGELRMEKGYGNGGWTVDTKAAVSR